MPTAAGTYEFRLFLDNGYIRAATSAPVVVDLALTPSPVVASLSPSRTFAGGGSFTLAVTGSGFVPSSIVRWNGVSRPTTFISTTLLRAAIGASDIVSTGVAQVTVRTPSPGGGTSGSLPVTIDVPPVALARRDQRCGRLRRHRDAHGWSGRFDRLAFDRAGRRTGCRRLFSAMDLCGRGRGEPHVDPRGAFDDGSVRVPAVSEQRLRARRDKRADHRHRCNPTGVERQHDDGERWESSHGDACERTVADPRTGSPWRPLARRTAATCSGRTSAPA